MPIQKKHSQKSSAGPKPNSLVLDIGTTGIKAFVFDARKNILAKSYQRLEKKFPRRGWVEQDPREFVNLSVRVLREAFRDSGVSVNSCVGLGIANQRETTVVWDRETGLAVYPAIVWEDARTKSWCSRMQKTYGEKVVSRTGLPVDSYFSVSKLRWILDHVPEAQSLVAQNRLLFGTVDSWVLWNLDPDRPHATDYTNAARTLLFDIKQKAWSEELCEIFGVLPSILPEAKPSHARFGVLSREILGRDLPIIAMVGDQQASLFAATERPLPQINGCTKVTYGTGVFINQVVDRFKLVPPFFTTIAPGPSGQPLFVLEAKINDNGKTVDRLLGKPAALKSYFTKLAGRIQDDLKKLPIKPRRLIIDGGATQYVPLAEIQSHASKVPVIRQEVFDGTALGVSLLMRDKKS